MTALDPSVHGNSRQDRNLAALLREYRTGDATSTLAEYLTWDHRKVLRELEWADRVSDGWTLAALALFNTESALRDRTVLASNARGDAARELMRTRVCPAAKASRDEALLRFCRGWYSTAGLSLRDVDLDSVLGDEAATHLVKGIRAERAMGPAVDSGGGTDHGVWVLAGELTTTSRGRFSSLQAGIAIQKFERALEIDARATEARLRLGRVFVMFDREDDAMRELERTRLDSRSTGDRFSEYLADLFLGDLHESKGRVADALTAYRRASDVEPRAPAARLAVTRLLWTSGDAAQGDATVRRLFDVATDVDGAADPWTVYPGGRGYWYRFPMLKQLRESLPK